MAINNKRVVVIVGGVGGAKMALGFQTILPPENLTVIVNTGDDFWHYGLRICPDIDTILYNLSGRNDKTQGWGVADESLNVLDSLRQLGEDAWFRLGDKDIATHLLRLKLWHEGQTLTQITQYLAQAMGIRATILPMANEFVETKVMTQAYGELDFQEYFVRHRWQPTVKSLRFDAVEKTTLSPEIQHALQQADVICFAPSNPWLSIAPVLAVNGLADLIRSRHIPRIAVSPIVGGIAIKGPAAKLMTELGHPSSAQAVATYYGDLINVFVYDRQDIGLTFADQRAIALDTIMQTDDDKARLAHEMLDSLESGSQP